MSLRWIPLVAVLVAAVALVAAACGGDDLEGSPALTNQAAAAADTADTAGDANGTVHVVMNEFGYVLDRTEFNAGETVTFEFTNEGAIEHEAMFGDVHEQEEFRGDTDHDHGDADHGDADHGDSDHGDTDHSDITAITLGAGESGSVTYTFGEAGELMLGCHLPGHWEAGMAATVTIT